MPVENDYSAPSRTRPDSHQRGADKLARIPVKIQPSENTPRKPA
ncbi:MAG TPA: lipoyl synthase, partial [Chromatiaceae bacterium]|nr:lipoyl synthase [Chromatiaceae bacterium]